MDSNNTWTTIAIAAVVSIIVSLVIVNLAQSPMSAPRTVTLAGNNTATSGSALGPDLIVANLVLENKTCNTNNTCSIHLRYTGQNIGNVAAGPHHNCITLRGPPMGNLVCFTQSGLAPGQLTSQSFVFPTVPYGNYTAYAVADLFDAIFETNENNNRASMPITVP